MGRSLEGVPEFSGCDFLLFKKEENSSNLQNDDMRYCAECDVLLSRHFRRGDLIISSILQRIDERKSKHVTTGKRLIGRNSKRNIKQREHLNFQDLKTLIWTNAKPSNQ